MIGAMALEWLTGMFTTGAGQGLAMGSTLLEMVAMFSEIFVFLLPIAVAVGRWLIGRRSTPIVQVIALAMLGICITRFASVFSDELVKARQEISKHQHDHLIPCQGDPQTTLLQTDCGQIEVTAGKWAPMLAINVIFGGWWLLIKETIGAVYAWITSGLWSIALVKLGIAFFARPVIGQINRRLDNRRRAEQHMLLDEKMAQFQTTSPIKTQEE